MPDRSLRLLTLPPQSVEGGEHRGVLLRERPASPPDAPSDRKTGDSPEDDNPFAPPPEGTPDRPWRPRRPADGENGDGSGDAASPWGSQWSDRQPGRSPGGFGQRPGGPPPSPEGQGGNTPGSGMRWDPTDPSQRRARYALLCGMWAFFFALFSWPYVALLLGALALYWGISALRAGAGASEPTNDPSGRPQTTAAVTGLVTASLAIALVAATFTAQMVYSDYYTCTNDALTNQAKQSCTQLLPKELRGLLGTNG
ncbi:hypothetical protein [Streptomyces guryensis]|uniref:Integral membrane protein n=1 Tax=Streptomyces guryensis TaxID=2886947 RepID=A0A9Q3VHL1_9ACTN|nr:hypothetical protein [Streptomyces guryensis]MCD9873438.1 hypothetical protein [Streptomyces guryensis]